MMVTFFNINIKINLAFLISFEVYSYILLPWFNFTIHSGNKHVFLNVCVFTLKCSLFLGATVARTKKRKRGGSTLTSSMTRNSWVGVSSTSINWMMLGCRTLRSTATSFSIRCSCSHKNTGTVFCFFNTVLRMSIIISRKGGFMYILDSFG